MCILDEVINVVISEVMNVVINAISNERTELSNFDSLMPIIAALDNLAIFQSLSILGNKLLTLGLIK